MVLMLLSNPQYAYLVLQFNLCNILFNLLCSNCMLYLIHVNFLNTIVDELVGQGNCKHSDLELTHTPDIPIALVSFFHLSI